MPTITDQAICIRSWDFSETSQTVSLFTREHGILRGLAKGSKREKGNFSGGLDVLTRGEVVANVKQGRDLSLITAWHLQDTWRWLRSNLLANRAALYIADLVHHMLIEHDPHPAAFDAMVGAIESMADQDHIDSALLRFQWLLLLEAGYQPQLDRDAVSGAALPANATLGFSPKAGGVVGDTTADAWKVRRETIELLRHVAKTISDNAVAMKSDSVHRANRLLAAYIREIIGSEPPAMRWAFPDMAR